MGAMFSRRTADPNVPIHARLATLLEAENVGREIDPDLLCRLKVSRDDSRKKEVPPKGRPPDEWVRPQGVRS